MDTIGNSNLTLPQLLGDLQVLALNPFYGIERKIPGAVQLFFRRFRFEYEACRGNLYMLSFNNFLSRALTLKKNE